VTGLLRHARAGGQPEIIENWFPAFAGMTEIAAVAEFG
jgi:hypothetical protein